MSEEKLFLGCAVSDITPPLGAALYGYSPDIFATSVHDNLTATAYVFGSGDKKAALITATVCEIATSLCDEIREKTEKETGIAKENVIIAATHTHSGPNTVGNFGWGDIDKPYCENIFVPKVLEAVKKANENKVHVVMGYAIGESRVGISRREKTVDNRVALGQNPWGPYDPDMAVISFKGDDGKTVANIVTYTCHGTCAGKNHEISRDWSGIMTDRLQTLTGGITAFFNGAEGDVGPRLTNGKTVGDITYTEETGGFAAADAVRIYNQIVSYREVGLDSVCSEVKIPLAPRIDYKEALRCFNYFNGNTVNLQGQKAYYYGNIVKSYDEGYEEKEYTSFMQSAVKVGDITFAAFPFEIVSEIGLRIKAYYKKSFVVSLSNANGARGYFVTEDMLPCGGYEVDMFTTAGVQNYGKNADFALITESIKNIEKLK